MLYKNLCSLILTIARLKLGLGYKKLLKSMFSMLHISVHSDSTFEQVTPLFTQYPNNWNFSYQKQK